MARLMEGARDDLTDIQLDWSGVAEFDRGVLDICRAIPPGQTLTYGEIARRLGDPALARGVGQALGRNPFPVIVPCHRVLGADGKVGGFSANGGVETKLKLLTIERARVGTAPTLFDDDPGFGLAAAPKR
jgi:methylated-DNA-[protein]-cysteine S-methyltransferase